MSNARDLALIEKWADIAAPPTLLPAPPLSPTSPRATKLCCCPNRRRYNLKQPKASSSSSFATAKSTLHARNIFADNEFTYIDDVPHENDSCNIKRRNNIRSTISSSSNSNNSNISNRSGSIGRNKNNNNSCKSKSNDCDNDYDDIVDISSNVGSSNSNNLQYDGNSAVKLMNERNEQQQKWKQPQSNSNNCLTQKIQQQQQQQQRDKEQQKLLTKVTIEKNCAVTKTQKQKEIAGNDNVALEEQQYKQQQQQTQRRSNSEHHFSNKENKLSSNNDKTQSPATTASATETETATAIATLSASSSLTSIVKATGNEEDNENNLRCNYCKLPEPQTNNNNNNSNSNNSNSNSKIDSLQTKQNKMTITATATPTTTPSAAAAATAINVVAATAATPNRKLSECGLTAATTATATAAATSVTTTASAAAAAGAVGGNINGSVIVAVATDKDKVKTPPTPPARSTTPSRLKTTVITTTMVKRSPSNDSNSNSKSPSPSPHMMLPITTNSCDGNSNTVTNDTSNISIRNNSNHHMDEPRRSVRERIAAYAAGNEQLQQIHDNAYKYAKNSCNNKNQKNSCSSSNNKVNMTSEVKSAISNRQQQHNQMLINGNSNKCATTAISNGDAAPATTPQATASVASAVVAPKIKSNTDKPRYKSGLSDVAQVKQDETSSTALDMAAGTASTATVATSPQISTASGLPVILSTGCATMPRSRRQPLTLAALVASDDCCNKYGSNTTTVTATSTSEAATSSNVSGGGGGGGAGAAAITVDKKFLSGAHKPLSSSSSLAQNVDKEQHVAGAAHSTHRKLAALDNLDLAHSLDLIDDDGEDPYFALQEYLERVKHEINEVFELRKAQRMQQLQQQHTEVSPATNAMAASSDELSRSTESDSGFDSATGERHAVTKCNGNISSAASSGTVTTKLRALPPPPLEFINDSGDDATGEQTPADVNIWANKFLRDLDNLMSSSSSTSASPDKQCGGSASSSPTSRTSPMLLSAAAKAAIQSRYGKGATMPPLKPEKHATIPLQSFNLDCGGRNDGQAPQAGAATPSSSVPVPSPRSTTVAYMRTLSAPSTDATSPGAVPLANGKNNRNSLAAFSALESSPLADAQEQAQAEQTAHQHHQLQTHNPTNFQSKNASSTDSTVLLKIEESAAAAAAAVAAAAAAGELKSRRQRQLENDMETIRNVLLSQLETTNGDGGGSNGGDGGCSINNKNMLVAATIPKRERINHATTTTTTSPTMNTKICETTRNSITPPPPTKTMSSTSGTTVATHLTPTTKMHSSGGGHNNNQTNSSYLLHGSVDVTKKGSTSTIWTSEESILRSVGAVDEDNNSTSSSACEEANGVLSSGKSGISLDSSGLDNDNNESGIGTATPPKDMSHWKTHPHHHHHHHHHHNDNESVSSLDALRKMKFQKSSSVVSSDDPDLLEVLSLFGDPNGNESHDDMLMEPSEMDKQQQQQQQQQQCKLSRHCRRRRQQHDDVNNIVVMDELELDDDDDADDLDVDEDEGHDEFETIRYCDCDCTDGDVSSASGGTSSSLRSSMALIASNNDSTQQQQQQQQHTSPVVLRRKYSPAPRILIPTANGNAGNGGGGRAQKCRSHSLDTSLSAPIQLHHHHHHQHHHQHQHHPHVHGLPPLTRKLQHLQARSAKERAQLSLALRQEPFQSLLSPTHFNELPSPSSASLHSGHESLCMQELTTKSNSAPLLLKQEAGGGIGGSGGCGGRKRDEFAAQNVTLRYSRSQSDRYLAEIEAVEACKWLRAAGFPQYGQMYEDHQFPIDLTNVAKDHTNLENDQLQSLYRRLCILNRCANMRLDQTHKPQTPQQKEDSDDENFALSENWTFQPHIRRWSRIGEMGLELPPVGKLNVEKTESSSKESSPDRFEDDTYDTSGAGITLMVPGTGSGSNGACSKSDATDTSLNETADSSGVRLRRTGSERFKDGAKAFLRRVESIKSRRRKRQNREGVVISGPQVLDLTQLSQRSSMRKPDGIYSTPPSPSAVSPMHTFPKGPFFGNELKVPSHSENFLSPNRGSPKRTPTTPRSMRTSPLHFFSPMVMPHLKEGKSDDSSSYYSDSQESSSTGGNKLSLRKTPSKARRFLQRTGKVDDIGAHSDSECHHGRKLLIKDANSNTTEVKIKKLTRGGSLNLGKDQKKRDGIRSSSFRSRSTTRKEHKPSEEVEGIKRTPVVRWHSFQMEERPHMIFRKCFSQKIEPQPYEALGIPFAGMSAGQLQIIRKLALVTLTGHMERYCPTHRSGWNWELPKFIKKIKMPDYKDKKVFGVPLLLILQRSGQSLPMAVRAAFRWLQLNALDQIGIFRKSGGKSRITKLRELIECADSTTECMDVFDTQQAYDVADMLKQYFRELPESLLTTKMSETFVAIFQHLPPEVRIDAVQCAVLLLPDENREILYVLLEFLTIVASNASQNQMTSNNLGVCLAQSIFHSSISTGSASVSASPRRKAGKGSGMPDIKELAEAKASHECLSFMIDNYKQIYTASKEKLAKCNFGYMEESKPVPLEALGEGMQFHNWRGYLYECTSATIKEGREKTRGWINITSQTSEPGVEIAYKKVGDGHPLRLWRCITEVEGPPRDVLEYIIKQRASWDSSLLQSQTLKKLDERTEIFQYALDGQLTTDFCVLRSWQTDLPRGACVIVETSIDHAKAKPMYGTVRGVVLASRYLIEPCGSGRSRVMHLARVDIKGKTPEWYNKIYGHICAHYLAKIRQAFRHVSEGPESKV